MRLTTVVLVVVWVLVACGDDAARRSGRSGRSGRSDRSGMQPAAGKSRQRARPTSRRPAKPPPRRIADRPGTVKCDWDSCHVTGGLNAKVIAKIRADKNWAKHKHLWFEMSSTDADLATVVRLGGEVRGFAMVGAPRITTLAPLAKLTKLDYLFLSRAPRVKDLRPIAKLTRLKRVTLSHLPSVTDLGPLAGLTELTYLSLETVRIGSFAFLKRLTKLTELRLESDMLQPSKALAEVEDKLKRAGAGASRDPRVALMYRLAGGGPGRWRGWTGKFALPAPLPKLVKLRLRLPVSDIRGFAKLPALKELTLQSTVLNDLSAMAHLKALEDLIIQQLPATDLSPLAKLTRMKRANIDQSPATKYDFLRRWRKLEDLTISMSNFDQLGAIPRGLRRLTLTSAMKIKRWAPLRRLTRLRRLDVMLTTFRDLALVAGMRRLEYLTINRCSVRNAHVLTRLRNLVFLDVSKVREVKPSMLRRFTKLKLFFYSKGQFDKKTLDALKKRNPKVQLQET